MGPDKPRLDVSVADGATVVRFLDARILDEMAIMQIADELKALVGQEGTTRLILDFSNVTHISSSALGTLITIHKKVRERGGQLRLACIQPSIYEVFVITRLKEIFRICPSVEDALESLG